MEKQELIKYLDNSFEALYDWYAASPNHVFSAIIKADKWSAGQHLLHLYKSAKPIKRLLNTNKLLLIYKFGRIKHGERDIDGLIHLYLNILKTTKLKAPKAFTPDPVDVSQKEILLEKMRQVQTDITRGVNQWSEKKLSRCGAPHPAFGMMTVRELVLFTGYHNGHHLEILKRDY